jgi:DNA-binding HxlR family transcriptional regulator
MRKQGYTSAMSQRSYNQYCPIAHALDLIGERWSLLIVRDLLLGPKRFSDLREGLPGIGTNILTDRLKHLEQGGLIARRVLPPPAASAVYELTPYGQGLDGPIQALAQWGGHSLGTAQPGQALSRDSVLLTVRALVRQLPASAEPEIYAFALSDPLFPEPIIARRAGEQLALSSGPAALAATVFRLDVNTLFALAGGLLALSEAIEQGAVKVEKQGAG